MATIEQEKKTRKRKYEKINIENEEKKLTIEDINIENEDEKLLVNETNDNISNDNVIKHIKNQFINCYIVKVELFKVFLIFI